METTPTIADPNKAAREANKKIREARDAAAKSVIEDLGELLAAFLLAEDEPTEYIFPELLPAGCILLFHGEPRARKSLAAFELALSAATGTAPFGLARFTPTGRTRVWYIQEEDGRGLTRKRLNRLVRERCGDTIPPMLVSVRRGINLDDPAYVRSIIDTCKEREIKVLVLDAARRLSAKTDEGPAKVRELAAVLRRLVDEAGVTLVIVHHDVKPSRDGQDTRRRGQRASGGDWFAMTECPVHVERMTETESLVFPQDYKFASDPAPFTFKVEIETTVKDGSLIRALVGSDTSAGLAFGLGLRGRFLDWLRANPYTSKTDLKVKGGFAWTYLPGLIDGLTAEGLIDFKPGRKVGSKLYFVIGSEPSNSSENVRGEEGS